MSYNTFLKFAQMLPVNIQKDKKGIVYNFPISDFTETEILSFIESELPGSIIDDWDPDFGYLSIHKEEESYKIFKGTYDEEYDDTKDDNSITTIWITELYSTENIFSFYTNLFNRTNTISRAKLELANITTPEELFWNFFNKNGFKEKNRSSEMDSGGYGLITIEFQKEDSVFYVQHPEKDYSPPLTIFYNREYLFPDIPEYITNWDNFFDAIDKGDILLYGGASRSQEE